MSDNESGSVNNENKTTRRKSVPIARKVMAVSAAHSVILGLIVLIVSVILFMYYILNKSYADTAYMGRTIADVLEANADVPGLVDAVLKQERENPDFDKWMKKKDPAHTNGQLLNYRWYTEENPPLAKREDYQKVMETILSFNRNDEDLNGSCLMVFDKQTHTAALLCDVEKFGGSEPVPVEEVLWRRFDDVELDHIEEERWSLAKNLFRYMKIDPRYVVFAWYEVFPYPDENVVVFIEADAFYTHLWANVFSYLLVFFLLILLIVLGMGSIYRKRMQKMISDPIDIVAKAAKGYAADRRMGDTKKDYFGSIELNTGDELEDLANTLGEMERDIGLYEENLTKATAEKERISTELGLATRIQADMLPSDFPLFPDRKEFDLYATMSPAKEVGGDFYDAFLIDDDHLCMVMGDVSGKGIPASLFMVVSKTMLKNRVQMGGKPSEILYDVNNSLCEGNKSMMFVTVWLGILTISTGELIQANAGHEYPVIQRKDSDYELIETDNGMVLGAMKKMMYKDMTFTLEPGDALFMYTDGLPEATDTEGKRLELEGMLEAINRHKDEGTNELLHSIRKEVDEFAKGASQYDDLTMLIFRYNTFLD